MAYMTNSNTSTTHEWWKDQADPESQRSFLQSYREAQREQSSQTWRRIGSFILLAVGVCFLARTFVSL